MSNELASELLGLIRATKQEYREKAERDRREKEAEDAKWVEEAVRRLRQGLKGRTQPGGTVSLAHIDAQNISGEEKRLFNDLGRRLGIERLAELPCLQVVAGREGEYWVEISVDALEKLLRNGA